MSYLRDLDLGGPPGVLAGVCLGVVMIVTTGHRINGAFETLLGYGLMPVAIGTCVAGHLLASRPHRSRTAELWHTLPTPAEARTLGALLALGGPMLVAGAYLAFAAALVGAWNGVPVALAEGIVALRPHPVELAQGLLAVACLGAFGVATGTWLPSRAVPVIMAAGLLVTFTVVGWRSADGWLRWALPMTHHDGQNLGWVQAAPRWGYSITDGYDRVAMAWHDTYVLALAGLAAAVALLRHRHGRVMGTATVALAGLTALLSSFRCRDPAVPPHWLNEERLMSATVIGRGSATCSRTALSVVDPEGHEWSLLRRLPRGVLDHVHNPALRPSFR